VHNNQVAIERHGHQGQASYENNHLKNEEICLLKKMTKTIPL
jgi:hypothetical protein